MSDPQQYEQTGQTVGRDQYNISNSGVIGHIGPLYQAAPVDVTFPVSNLPLANPHFIGRSDHLTTLAEETDKPVAIIGLGGVGKSQLMLHFAHAHEDDFDIIWWLRVDQAWNEDFIGLGRQLGLAVDGIDRSAAMQLVRGWLTGTDKRWLLLCDGADETEPRQLRVWLPGSENGRVLITSRSPDWQGMAAELNLNVFSAEEAAVFWDGKLGAVDDSDEADSVNRATLAETLGYLPLALEHAAAYMAANGMGAERYLSHYERRREGLWARAETPDDYHATITTTWELAFQKAKETAGAVDLLDLCCFLAPDHIPVWLMAGLAEREFLGEIVPPEFAAVLADELALNDALRALERYSLIEQERREGMEGPDMLRIHRPVQAVVRDRMGEARRQMWIDTAVNFIDLIFIYDRDDMTTWEDAHRLLPHVKTVLGLADQLGVQTNLAATLNNLVGNYLVNFGMLQEVRPYYERALAIRQEVLEPNDIETATSLNNLALLMHRLGELKGAKPYYDQALAIFETVLGRENSITATTLNNIGGLLNEMGNLAEAKIYYEQALAIQEKVSGADHPDTALCLNNLAELLKQMGELEAAKPYYERSLAIHEEFYGPEHPNTASALNNMGSYLDAFGQPASAIPHYERAIAIYEKVYDPDHPDIARILNNLATVYHTMGNLAQAAAYYERVLEIELKVFGPDHPSTGQGFNNFGAVLRDMGQLEAAKPYLEQGVMIHLDTLGLEHPNTAHCLHSLASLLTELGDHERALSYFEAALAIREDFLGPEHPLVAETLSQLGELMKAMGDLPAARVYAERTLVIQEKVFGEVHDDTGLSCWRLGVILEAEGQVAEAQVYYRRCYDIYSQVFGPEHELTEMVGAYLREG